MNVLTQIAALFIVMATGFALGKAKLIDGTAVKTLSALIVKVSLPALIITSLQREFNEKLLLSSWLGLSSAVVFYAFGIGLSFLAVILMRTPRKQRGPFIFALSFSNAAFIGFPVVTSILGEGALFLTSIHNILFNVLAFSVGIIIMARYARGEDTPDAAPGGNSRFLLTKLLNINVLAAVAGFILFLLSVRIPDILSIPLKMIGGLTTPVAMLVTGAMLSRTPVKSVFGDWRCYAVTALRLAVWPLLAALGFRFMNLGDELFAINIIIAGMPAASNTSLIAEVYGGDTDTASSAVFMTTLFSVLSIPLIAVFLG